MSKEVKIGILGVLLLFGFIYGYAKFRSFRKAQLGLVLHVRFDEVDELDRMTTIMINGLEVGLLSGIYQKGQHIYARINVLTEQRLPKDTKGVLIQPSIVGGRAIELQYKTPCSGPDCLQSGDTIQGEVRTLTVIMSETLRNKVLLPVDTFLQPLASKDITEMIRETEASLARLAGTTAILNSQLFQQSGPLNRTIASAQSSTEAMKSSSASWGASLDGLNNSLKQIAALQMQAQADSLGSYLVQADSFNRQMQRQLVKAEDEIVKADKLLQQKVGPDGQFADLFHDRAMRDSLKVKVKALQEKLVDIRLHPEKYRQIKKRKS